MGGWARGPVAARRASARRCRRSGHRSIPFASCEVQTTPGAIASPAELDFGAVEPLCETRDREFEVVNVEGSNLVLVDAGLSEGSSEEFFVRSFPPENTVIAPGAAVELTVAYRPVDRVPDEAKLLVWFEGYPEPLRVTLRGEGGPPDVQHETFERYGRPKVDWLFVIDNGATMAVESAAILDESGRFPEHVRDFGLDGRYAVTTTGLVVDGEEVPQNQGEEWCYDRSINAVCFPEDRAPAPEALVEAEYLVA
jgi:hypothetical protein